MTTPTSFGHVDTTAAHLYTLHHDGISVRTTDAGARLVDLLVADRHGHLDDIALGCDRAEDYLHTPTFMGATVGRYAGRIAHAAIDLDGRTYRLDANRPPHHLHGGRESWDTRLWTVTDLANDSITFTLHSPDGDMGYPGEVTATCTYALSPHHLTITMTATTTADTIINMINHVYLNLAGHDSGTALDQLIQIPADHYLVVDNDLIPTGEMADVTGTRYDFRTLRPLREGYDDTWCLHSADAPTHLALVAHDPVSGRTVRVTTTEPGLTLFNLSSITEPVRGKNGASYGRHAGFTIETQKFPNSPRIVDFPSPLLRAGETYRHVMELDFTVM